MISYIALSLFRINIFCFNVESPELFISDRYPTFQILYPPPLSHSGSETKIRQYMMTWPWLFLGHSLCHRWGIWQLLIVKLPLKGQIRIQIDDYGSQCCESVSFWCCLSFWCGSGSGSYLSLWSLNLEKVPKKALTPYIMAFNLQIDADPDLDPAYHFDVDPGPIKSGSVLLVSLQFISWLFLSFVFFYAVAIFCTLSSV